MCNKLEDFNTLGDSKYMFTRAHFMALLTVNRESALTEAGNFPFRSSVFHGLAIFALAVCTQHSLLTQLA